MTDSPSNVFCGSYNKIVESGVLGQMETTPSFMTCHAEIEERRNKEDKGRTWCPEPDDGKVRDEMGKHELMSELKMNCQRFYLQYGNARHSLGLYQILSTADICEKLLQELWQLNPTLDGNCSVSIPASSLPRNAADEPVIWCFFLHHQSQQPKIAGHLMPRHL